MNTLFERNEPFYKEERPKNAKLKLQYGYSIDENPVFSISWTEKESKTNSMPEVTFDASTRDITRFFAQVVVWSFDER